MKRPPPPSPIHCGSSTLSWMARQLQGGQVRVFAVSGGARTPPPFRPSGEIWPGSATDAAHAWLSGRHPLGWWTRQQIVAGTGRNHKAVDWALLFLRSTDRIEVSPDSRNARYLRYRIKGERHGQGK